MARTFRMQDGTSKDPTTLEDGRHLIADDLGGVRVFAEVKNKKVISYESEGGTGPVEILLLRSEVAPNKKTAPDQRPGVKCWICACSTDICTCIPTPCP